MRQRQSGEGAEEGGEEEEGVGGGRLELGVWAAAAGRRVRRVRGGRRRVRRRRSRMRGWFVG